MEELINYDQQLFLFLNSLGTETWDGFWMFITDKLSSIPLYLVLLFFSYKKLGLKPTLLLLVFVALMITASDQLSNAFKNGFARLRPCHDEAIFSQMRLVKSYCGGKFGYFSAHASNSFAVATFFALLLKGSNKWWPAFLLIWALSVAYSRIYIGVHYPLDVITGMSFGMLFGWGFYKLFTLTSKRLIRN
ncbi:phosphatase PAP2 family protein [Spongiivirga citrea]|uniref:Phosphatase PAP2 family protein n=1 Tax=Spongiivirga citrea TaxID=1481457 RepID=A0A6M0CKS1_9FLAO|nr:phosphatase PAP2 family protein [Spongiivirga citrea]NER16037.1 phosphatase PAP2 family protein [Spongiivirga citrea]